MIDAERTGRRPDRYGLRRDGRLIGSVTLGTRMDGGTFEVHDVVHTVRAGDAPGSYELVTVDGSVVATAGQVHRRTWSLHSADGSRDVRRSVFARVESLTDAAGHELGRVSRSGRSGAAVDLPGSDLAVQVFVLALVLMRLRRRRRIATRTTAVSAIGR